MTKIKVLDFAKNVEYNRNRLLKNIESSGYSIENNSLNNIVDTTLNIIKNKGSQEHLVRWINPDGSVILQQSVEHNTAVQHPVSAEFDSEYLEFAEWSGPNTPNNIYRDIDYGAIYKVIPDAEGRRWTHLFCYFTDAELSPALNLYRAPENVTANLYVDWGDGTVNTFNSGTNITASHTYAAEGLYVIKIYCDYYGWYFQNKYILGSFDYSKALSKIYFGDNIYSIGGQHVLTSCYSLCVMVIPPTVTALLNGLLYLTNGVSTLILPRSITSIASSTINGYGLNNIVLPENLPAVSQFMYSAVKAMPIAKLVIPESWTAIPQRAFSGLNRLTEVCIPKNIKSIGSLAFENCTALQKVTFEPGTNITTLVQGCFTSTLLSILELPGTLQSIGDMFKSGGGQYIESVNFGHDFDASIILKSFCLTEDALYNMAIKLKDNSNTTAKIIQLSQYIRARFMGIYINQFDEKVNNTSAGAIPLLQYIQNKNWTVSFG